MDAAELRRVDDRRDDKLGFRIASFLIASKELL